jgi:Lar family restriction alleviation protein
MTPVDARNDLVERLLPCPFCGGSATLKTFRTSEDSEGAQVECKNCGARTEATDDAYADTATACMIWNTRAPNPEAATRIQQLTARTESAEAQVERLREALERIADPTSFWSKHEDIARAALNAKPVEK